MEAEVKSSSILNNKRFRGFVAAAAIAGLISPALAGRSADETKSFVERAVAHIKAVGPEKAFGDFTGPGRQESPRPQGSRRRAG
jgi:hypothetical protein